MRRLLVRLSAAAAAAGLATAGLVAAAVPAQAAACSGTTGVTVVIDTGSSTSTSCAPSGGSAMTALRAVATVVSPQRYPGQVVCRINGAPASDPCIQMPPASAYWAFFHAPRGGSWTYSSLGVASYTPKAGSVIGFRFGSGQQPRTAPPAAASTPKPTAKPKPTTAAPKPTTKPKATTRPTTGGGGTTAGSGSAATPRPGTSTARPSSGATPSASPTGTADTTTPTPSTTVDPTTAPSDEPGATETSLAAAPASTTEGSGTGTLVAGGALVALVGAGAALAAWRRRA